MIRPLSPPKKVNKLKSLIFRKKAKDQPNKLTKQLSSAGMVEEIFEEGSAILSERLVVTLAHICFTVFDMKLLCIFSVLPC